RDSPTVSPRIRHSASIATRSPHPSPPASTRPPHVTLSDGDTFSRPLPPPCFLDGMRWGKVSLHGDIIAKIFKKKLQEELIVLKTWLAYFILEVHHVIWF
ncbi:hypothetical protein AVEN_118968-1, partial [Araneus ventricosus]